MDSETIGVLVVAVNAVVGFAIRMFVAPVAAPALPRRRGTRSA